jgi:hypothetical protein
LLSGVDQESNELPRPNFLLTIGNAIVNIDTVFGGAISKGNARSEKSK